MVVSGDGTGTESSRTGTIDLTDALAEFGTLSQDNGTDGGITVDAGKDAPLFIIKTEDDGSITGDIVTSESDITYSVAEGKAVLNITSPKWNNTTAITGSVNVLVDYYVVKNSETVS
jgi:hypothetical protein